MPSDSITTLEPIEARLFKDPTLVEQELNAAQAEYDNAHWLTKANWLLSNDGTFVSPRLESARQDMQEFQRWDESLSFAEVNKAVNELIQYDAGLLRARPEEAAKRRAWVSHVNRYYMGDSPFLVAGPGEAEIHLMQAAFNSYEMASRGPFVMMSGYGTRAMGGNEKQVAATVRQASTVDLGAIFAGRQSLAPVRSAAIRPSRPRGPLPNARYQEYMALRAEGLKASDAAAVLSRKFSTAELEDGTIVT